MAEVQYNVHILLRCCPGVIFIHSTYTSFIDIFKTRWRILYADAFAQSADTHNMSWQNRAEVYVVKFRTSEVVERVSYNLTSRE